MNSYQLSRTWFDFCFENPQKVKPYHSAIYFFAIEHCNRLGWKQVFGFPTSMVLESIGMKSYNSYKKYFDELVDFGFIKVHEYSKNQYSSNIIELTSKGKAQYKALDKALIKHTSKHTTKQRESTSESIDSIIKQITSNNITIEQINKEQREFLIKFLTPSLKIDKITKEEYDQIKMFFNETCKELPKIIKITETRKTIIRNILKKYKKEEIGEVFKLVSTSNFMNGKNERGWKADFDWILKPKNFLKILEGNFQTVGKGNKSSIQKQKDDAIIAELKKRVR